MVLEYLFLNHILTEFKEIDTVDEILFRKVVAFAFTDALNGLSP